MENRGVISLSINVGSASELEHHIMELSSMFGRKVPKEAESDVPKKEAKKSTTITKVEEAEQKEEVSVIESKSDVVNNVVSIEDIRALINKEVKLDPDFKKTAKVILESMGVANLTSLTAEQRVVYFGKLKGE